MTTSEWTGMANKSCAQQRKWEIRCWWSSGGQHKLEINLWSHLMKLRKQEVHTSYLPTLWSTFKTVVFVCFGSIKMKGDEVNDLIDAMNDWTLWSLAMLCTVHPGTFRAKKRGKVALSFVFKNLSEKLFVSKMTMFGPQGLTRGRTHCMLLLRCKT
jgi:hypothetical protein